MSNKFILIIAGFLLYTISLVRAGKVVIGDNYFKNTLPYETECLLAATNRLRKMTKDDVKYTAEFEGILMEDMFRLHFYLVDPSFKDEEKQAAKNVMLDLIDYFEVHDISKNFVRDREYIMNHNNVIIPEKVKVRNLYEEILASKAELEKAANPQHPRNFKSSQKE